MAFSIEEHRREAQNETVRWWEAKTRIYVDATRTKVVEEGSAEASFLLASPGKRIPIDTARALGLVKSRGAANKGTRKGADDKGEDDKGDDKGEPDGQE